MEKAGCRTVYTRQFQFLINKIPFLNNGYRNYSSCIIIYYFSPLRLPLDFPGGAVVNAGDSVHYLGQEDPLEKEMATPSSILAWRIPWTEEPGGLQSMGSQRVRHNLATKQEQQNKSLLDFKQSKTKYQSKFCRVGLRTLYNFASVVYTHTYCYKVLSPSKIL